MCPQPQAASALTHGSLRCALLRSNVSPPAAADPLLYVKNRRHLAAFACKYVERARCCLGIHYFETDTLSGEREHEFSRRKYSRLARAKEDNFGFCLEHAGEVLDLKPGNGLVTPAVKNLVVRNCDRAAITRVAD